MSEPVPVMSGNRVRRRRSRRPRAVSLVAGLHLVQAMLAFIFVALAAWDPEDLAVAFIQFSYADTPFLSDLFGGVITVALGALFLFVAIGLYRLESWAWLAAMTIQALALTLVLLDRFTGDLDLISLLLPALVIFALNQGDVRQAFR